MAAASDGYFERGWIAIQDSHFWGVFFWLIREFFRVGGLHFSS